MNFDEFENLARLYVVGALDEEEMELFLKARKELGLRAEATITEFRRLSSVFALSLRPHAPKPDTKHKLLARIRESIGQDSERDGTELNELFRNNLA